MNHERVNGWCRLTTVLVLAGVLEGMAQDIPPGQDTSSGAFAVGYWNDNILFSDQLNRLFGEGTFGGSDDLQTANFWFRWSIPDTGGVGIADAYLNVLTSRPNQFRYDLLTVRWTRELIAPDTRFRYGVGLMLGGNFGGRTIQNAYHHVSSIESVNLPYYPTSLGYLAVYGSVRPTLYEQPAVTLRAAMTASWLTGGGPSFFETGITAIIRPPSAPWLSGRAHVGGVIFYQTPALLRPLFGSGIVTGYLVSIAPRPDIWVSLWHTYNQYGKRQRHFGIALSAYPIGVIDDICFP